MNCIVSFNNLIEGWSHPFLAELYIHHYIIKCPNGSECLSSIENHTIILNLDWIKISNENQIILYKLKIILQNCIERIASKYHQFCDDMRQIGVD